MGMSEEERKEKARIFDLLVNHYGAPGRVMNPRNHTNFFAVLWLRADLNALDRG